MEHIAYAPFPEDVGLKPNMRLDQGTIDACDAHYNEVLTWCKKHCRHEFEVDETLIHKGIRVRFGDEKDLQFFALKWVK